MHTCIYTFIHKYINRYLHENWTKYKHPIIHAYIIKLGLYSYIRTYIETLLSQENPASNAVEIIFLSVKNTPRSNSVETFFLGRTQSKWFFLGRCSSRSKKLLDRIRSKHFSSVEHSRTVSSRSKFFSVEMFFLGRTLSNYRQFGSRRSKHTIFWSSWSKHNSQTSTREVATYLFWVAQMFRSQKVATYPFWVAMIAIYIFWVAQSRNISILGRANISVAQDRNIASLSRTISVLGRANSRKYFGRTRSQHSQFESQWTQHTRYRSQWSQHTHFESQWSQNKSLTTWVTVIDLSCENQSFSAIRSIIEVVQFQLNLRASFSHPGKKDKEAFQAEIRNKEKGEHFVMEAFINNFKISFNSYQNNDLSTLRAGSFIHNHFLPESIYC